MMWLLKICNDNKFELLKLRLNSHRYQWIITKCNISSMWATFFAQLDTSLTKSYFQRTWIKGLGQDATNVTQQECCREFFVQISGKSNQSSLSESRYREQVAWRYMRSVRRRWQPWWCTVLSPGQSHHSLSTCIDRPTSTWSELDHSPTNYCRLAACTWKIHVQFHCLAGIWVDRYRPIY